MEQRIQISKEFRFEAAHHLLNYDGLCNQVHGHSYFGEVIVSATQLVNGMVMDYKDLKLLIEEVIVSKYDHKDLNTCFDFSPTAELMVEKIFSDFKDRLKDFNLNIGSNIKLEQISLKETDKSKATIMVDS